MNLRQRLQYAVLQKVAQDSSLRLMWLKRAFPPTTAAGSALGMARQFAPTQPAMGPARAAVGQMSQGLSAPFSAPSQQQAPQPKPPAQRAIDPQGMPYNPADLLLHAGPDPRVPPNSPLAPQFVGRVPSPQAPQINLNPQVGMQVPQNPLSQVPGGSTLLQSAGRPDQLVKAQLGGRLPVPQQPQAPRGAALPRPSGF